MHITFCSINFTSQTVKSLMNSSCISIECMSFNIRFKFINKHSQLLYSTNNYDVLWIELVFPWLSNWLDNWEDLHFHQTIRLILIWKFISPFQLSRELLPITIIQSMEGLLQFLNIIIVCTVAPGIITRTHKINMHYL